MSARTENDYQPIGETRGCQDHDHDVVQELSRRLDAVWRYDQYIANASGHTDLQSFWRLLKAQEKDNIRQLKELLAQHVASGCF